MAISTNGTIITRLAGALYNEYLSNASYTELNTTPAATVAGNMLSSDFAGKTDAQIATTVLTNLGLSSVAGLNNWVAAQLTGAGSTAAAKGAKLVSMLNDFAMMTADATYGSYATAFNANTAASLATSQKAGSASGSFATSGAAAAAATAAAKVIADAAAAKVIADADAAAAKVITDAAAAKVIAEAAAAKIISDAAAAALAPQKFALTTGVDSGADFTGKDGSDTYTAVTGTTGLQALTAGDNLNGGLGADTLNITNTAAATLGAGVITTAIETVNVTATAATTIDASSFTGVTAVSSTGSTSDVIFSNLPAIADVSITAATGATSVGFATAVTSGAADSIKLALNGATGAISVAGFETVNVTTAGTASGTATAPVVITDSSLTKLTVTGTTANFLSASFEGASGTTVATVTGSAGADSLVLTAGGSAKVSGDMGAGNDNLRVSTIAAGYTVAGGEGTDTITYGGTASVAATATANLSTFETVTLTAAPASFSMAGATTVNYTTVAPTASTYVGLASGGTLALPLGGTTTLTNTLWTTPTTDTMTVTVGASTTAGALTAAVTTTGMESVTITNSSVGTDTTSLRTVGVTDALLKSLTVTGNQPTALTGGGAALTTVNVSGVTGNVTMTGLSLSTTAASNITGGDGNDTLTAATASLADTIVGGAGNDTINGAQGADNLTGGAGNDTFTIASNSATVGVAQQSGATLMDTITDFVSGTDKLNLAQATSFLGNYANLTAGLAATAGSGVGANQAFYSLADNIVYVIASASGVLASTDTMVKLSNAPEKLAAGDLNFGTGGNTITLATGAVTVAFGTAATNSTTYNDTINTTAALLVGATVDGSVGSGDTLNVTDSVGTGITLAAQVTGIEIVNLMAGSTAIVVAPALTSLSLAINNTHASNPSSVTLGAQTTSGTQSFTSTGTGIDTVVAGAPNQSISTGAGDDVVTASAANFLGGTFNGGSGTNDVLNLTANGTTGITAGATATTGAIAAVTGFERINVTTAAATGLFNITPDAAVTIFSLTSGITVAGTGSGGVITVSGLAGAAVTVNGTAAFTVSGNNTTGDITFDSTGTKNVIDSANTHQITNNSTTVVTVDATLQTATDTLLGAGPFTINNLIAAGTIAGSGATGVITVNGTTAAAHSSIVTGSAADVVTITGTAANAQTITTNAGNDTVTLTGTGAANVVDLGAGNDTYLAGSAGGSVTGGLGSDSMTGGAGTDVFLYGTGDSGGVTTDTITGLNFNADVIRVNATMTSAAFAGGTGTTTASGYNNFNATTGVITIQTDDGTMSINTASSSNTPTVTGSLQTSSVIQYYITGSVAADTIATGAGADSILSGIGNDIINAGLGADTIVGGAGDDAITLTESVASADTVVFSGATTTLNGADTITGFTVGTGGDVLNFGSLTSGALVNTVTAGVITVADATALATQGTTIAVATNKVYFIKAAPTAANIDTAAEVIVALTDTGDIDAVDVAASATCFLVIGGADDVTKLYVYGVVNDATPAVATGELLLLGTITVTSLGLVGGNFSF